MPRFILCINVHLIHNTKPVLCEAPVAILGVWQGVRAGWMGRMPDIDRGWAWPALGLCRGAIEVSVVGTGSVSLLEREEKD